MGRILIGFRLALTHHPLCWNFQEDTLPLGRGVRVCAGCALAAPGLAVGLVTSFVWLATHSEIVLPWMAASFALGIPQLASYLRRGNRLERAATKFIGGLGLGGVLACLPWLPISWPWRIAGLAALGVLFLALQAIRLRQIMAVCTRCPWQRRWEACPGFNPP